MDVFQIDDYRRLIRERIRVLRARTPAFTIARIAQRLRLEPTYLSRVLRSENLHFSEDQLFRILRALGFSAVERDYVFVLRAYQSTALAERRADLERAIRFRKGVRDFTDLRRVRDELRRIEAVVSRWIEETSDGESDEKPPD